MGNKLPLTLNKKPTSIHLGVKELNTKYTLLGNEPDKLQNCSDFKNSSKINDIGDKELLKHSENKNISAPKSCGASERRKWFVAIFVSVFVLSVIMLLLVFRTFSKPAHISLDRDALSLTDHWELLHFKHEGNEKEVCSISSEKPFCSIELCSRPSIANGNWLCESSRKMKNIAEAHDNSFRILNSFHGTIQIRVSMYRIVSEKYGFVVNKNKVPIINCVFHKLHDASVNASAECLSVTSSRRYQLTTSNNRTLLKSEINCMDKYVNFMKDDELSVNFYGETCLCGKPWIFLQNINNSF